MLQFYFRLITSAHFSWAGVLGAFDRKDVGLQVPALVRAVFEVRLTAVLNLIQSHRQKHTNHIQCSTGAVVGQLQTRYAVPHFVRNTTLQTFGAAISTVPLLSGLQIQGLFYVPILIKAQDILFPEQVLSTLKFTRSLFGGYDLIKLIMLIHNAHLFSFKE